MGSGGVRAGALALALAAGLAALPRSARADELESTADLDGLYLALGPTIGALRAGGGWDAAVGGELVLYRLRERDAASVLGASLGGLKFSTEERGHVWGDLVLGSRAPLGIPAGVSVGVTGELSEVAHPRWGAHATLWLFAGVVPYARVGSVQESGTFVDFGIRIALPAARW